MVTAHTDTLTHAQPARAPNAPLPAALAVLAALAAVLAAQGNGPLAVALLPFVVATGFALLGQATPWLWLLVAFSGIGLSWAEGAIGVGARSINIAGLQWGLTFVLGALLLALLPRTRERWPGVFRWYAVFVALTVLWVLPAADRFTAVKNAVQYATPLVVGLVTLRAVRTRGTLLWLRGALWAAFAIAAVIGLVSLQWSTMTGSAAGLSGALGNRTFAIFLVPVFALALAGWRTRGPAYGLIAAAAFVLVLLTLSRTVTATCIVLGAVALLWDASWGARLRALLLLAAVATMVVSFEPLRERMLTGGMARARAGSATVEVTGEGREAQFNVSGISLSGRGLLWLQTWRHAMQAPLTGHGTGSAESYLGAELQGVAEHPHNDYLRLFHDAGAVGLLVTLAMAAGGLVSLARLQRRGRSVLARELALAAFLSWLGYLMIAVTDNIFVYVSFFTQNLFLLIALAWRAAAEDAAAVQAPA